MDVTVQLQNQLRIATVVGNWELVGDLRSAICEIERLRGEANAYWGMLSSGPLAQQELQRAGKTSVKPTREQINEIAYHLEQIQKRR